MGRLLLVRHGQASFLAADYDRLSPLGAVQMRRLGAHWGAAGLAPDRVWVGPLRRQEASCGALVEGMIGEGDAAPPEPRTTPALNEYEALPLMARVVKAGVAAGDRALAELARIATTPGPGQSAAKEQLFRDLTGCWVRGEIDTPPDVEAFPAFRARVSAGLGALLREGGRGETVVAVSSGGVVAATVGWALGLSDVATMELSWVVRNASVTELLYTRDAAAPEGLRISLHVFNALPHLRDPAEITYR